MSPFKARDKVIIIDSMASDWIGREAVITKVYIDDWGFYFYELNIGGGHWTPSNLKKI
jgi:hypothetical protein